MSRMVQRTRKKSGNLAAAAPTTPSLETNASQAKAAQTRLREQETTQLSRFPIGLVVVLLCAFAGLRILIFCAAFPLFNNIDEPAHFAAIEMYAQGHWPGKDLPHYDSDTAKVLALYASDEYLTPTQYPAHAPSVPPYRFSAQSMNIYLPQMMTRILNDSNHEAQSAPLYYLLAAAWLHVGAVLGMNGWQLAYWIRFLNPVAYALLVWFSYRLVRRAFAARPFLWLAVPAFLAVFPQDVYFGINRDVLSAPLSALALWLMVEAVMVESNKETSRSWLLIAASFVVSLAFLVNLSNCVLYACLAVTLWVWLKQTWKVQEHIGRNLTLIVFSAFVLPALWMLRNYHVMGDLAGAQTKIAALGWTSKPFGELFDHPLFSLHGLRYFFKELTGSFWRGEYVWHLEGMRWALADKVYLFSTALMFAAFMIGLWLEHKTSPRPQRFLSFQALLLVFGSVAFMAAISLAFDFHNNPYPSREFPYFVSGRIILGALPAFGLIYVGGLELLLTRIHQWAPFTALAVLMLFITVSEFRIRQVAFSSPYNFLALMSWDSATAEVVSVQDKN